MDVSNVIFSCVVVMVSCHKKNLKGKLINAGNIYLRFWLIPEDMQSTKVLDVGLDMMNEIGQIEKMCNELVTQCSYEDFD